MSLEYLVKVESFGSCESQVYILDSAKACTLQPLETENFFLLSVDEELPYKCKESFALIYDDREFFALMIYPVIKKFLRSNLLSSVSSERVNDEKEIATFVNLHYGMIPLKKNIDFFSLTPLAMLSILTKLELQGVLKIFEVAGLRVINRKFFSVLCKKFKENIVNRKKEGEKSIDFLQISQNLPYKEKSLVFKYLVKKYRNQLKYRIYNGNQLVFKNIGEEEEISNKSNTIMKVLRQEHFFTFCIEDIEKLTSLSEKEVNDTLWYMLNEDDILQISRRYFMLNNDYNKVINILKKYKRNYGEEIDIQTFKRLTSMGRVHVVNIFEHLDEKGITSRMGKIRRIQLTV